MDITFGTGFVCPRCGREARYTTGFWSAFTVGLETNRTYETLDERGGWITSQTCGHRWRVGPGQRRGVDLRDYDDWPWQTEAK